MKITIGLVDDKNLFIRSLEALVNTQFSNMEVIVTANSGALLLQRLAALPVQPDIILVDVKMSGDTGDKTKDGPEVARRIRERYPLIKLVALSSVDTEASIIGMLNAGCSAYLLKEEIVDTELERAILEVYDTGFYNGDGSNIRYRRLAKEALTEHSVQLTEKEITFLQLACSDRTYKQIANDMHLSERTIDGYRESLFEKLKVQSKVGMALEAIRLKIVTL